MKPRGLGRHFLGHGTSDQHGIAKAIRPPARSKSSAARAMPRFISKRISVQC
jgi:hypothetical protein